MFQLPCQCTKTANCRFYVIFAWEKNFLLVSCKPISCNIFDYIWFFVHLQWEWRKLLITLSANSIFCRSRRSYKSNKLLSKKHSMGRSQARCGSSLWRNRWDRAPTWTWLLELPPAAVSPPRCRGMGSHLLVRTKRRLERGMRWFLSTMSPFQRTFYPLEKQSSIAWSPC